MIAAWHGTPTSVQENSAKFAVELFSKIAHRKELPEEEYIASALDEENVLVAENIRGGGRIFVDSQNSVLFVGSSLSFDEAFESFSKGRRTSLENF